MTQPGSLNGFHVKRPARAQTLELLSVELPAVDREIRDTEERLVKLRAYRERLVCTGAIWGHLAGTADQSLETVPLEAPDGD